MKKALDRGWMIILAFVMVSALSITTTKAQGSVSLQVFYDELQPYGTWMDHGQYGYVWMPRVETGFVPYGTNGYWINTEYGNTWVSDYDWGWAPFHYGRWFFDDFYGWIWVPDSTWGPAWVAWRNGGGYYGWAPLMPGFGIHLSYNYYDRIPNHYWNFVPHRYVTYRHVYRHCVPQPRVVNIIHQTTIITHNHTDNRRQTYFTGPTRREIERSGGGRVEVHSVSDRSRPGRTDVSRNGANFYRPQIDNSRDSRSSAMPEKFVRRDRSGNLEEVESRERSSANPNTQRSLPEQRMRTRTNNDPVESLERRRSSVPNDVQRREYQPSQRSEPSERQSPARTYEQLQRQPNNNARDRFEAPPVQRNPENREMQRRSTAQPQQRQQTQRESPAPQRENMNVQRDRPSSFRENSTRSSAGQSQRSTEFRNRNSGSSGQPKVNMGGSRSGPTRRGN